MCSILEQDKENSGPLFSFNEGLFTKREKSLDFKKYIASVDAIIFT